MLIGVNGTKGSGKDTVGKYLVEEYGFERLSFAAKLKSSAAALFDIDPALWDQFKNDENSKVILKLYGVNAKITVREFLQRYGTEAHRDIFGGDFWVDALFNDLEVSKDNDYVITDARFPNELKKIKELNGFNIRLLRRQDLPEDLHSSEASPPPIYIDAWIRNESSLDELYDKIDEFMIQFPLVDKSVAAFKA